MAEPIPTLEDIKADPRYLEADVDFKRDILANWRDAVSESLRSDLGTDFDQDQLNQRFFEEDAIIPLTEPELQAQAAFRPEEGLARFTAPIPVARIEEGRVFAEPIASLPGAPPDFTRIGLPTAEGREEVKNIKKQEVLNDIRGNLNRIRLFPEFVSANIDLQTSVINKAIALGREAAKDRLGEDFSNEEYDSAVLGELFRPASARSKILLLVGLGTGASAQDLDGILAEQEKSQAVFKNVANAMINERIIRDTPIIGDLSRGAEQIREIGQEILEILNIVEGAPWNRTRRTLGNLLRLEFGGTLSPGLSNSASRKAFKRPSSERKNRFPTVAFFSFSSCLIALPIPFFCILVKGASLFALLACAVSSFVLFASSVATINLSL